MANVENFDDSETRLTSKSFGEFLRGNAKKFSEEVDQIKALADLFSLALRTPSSEQDDCFRDILEEARRQEISNTSIRIALNIALEKKYPRRTDLLRKARSSINDLLSS
ncbi:hypothetical protein KKF38_03750 [Patescibacteria group bacterium]|nr:hypothetical protein [Patescibacteria group bacterium]